MYDSSSEYYVWSVEGKPVSVHLRLDVVQQMSELVAGPPAAERVTERGGFLLGRGRQVNESYIVSVEGFEEADCEHARGPSWTLSRSDQQTFARQLRRLASKGIVGYFRTHSRPGLFLDQHDFELMRQYFSHPAAVSLVIRTDAEAGFFTWEDGDMERTRPAKTFPFRRESLGAAVRPVEIVEVEQKPPQLPALQHQRPSLSLPALPPLPSFSPGTRLRSAVRWSPVLVGLAAGWFWTPGMFRELGSRQSQMATAPERPARTAVVARVAEQRPVFGVTDEAGPIDTSEQTEAAPAVQTRSRPAPRKKLEPPRQKVASLRPVLEAPEPPPVLAAARFEPTVIASAPAPPPIHRVEASWEVARASGLRRAVGTVPGLGFLKKKKGEQPGWEPPRPVREYRPTDDGFDEDVRVRVRIGEAGEVRTATLLTRDVSAAVAESAVEAARRWQFEPAREKDQPVESELVITFRSKGKRGS